MYITYETVDSQVVVYNNLRVREGGITKHQEMTGQTGVSINGGIPPRLTERQERCT